MARINNFHRKMLKFSWPHEAEKGYIVVVYMKSLKM